MPPRMDAKLALPTLFACAWLAAACGDDTPGADAAVSQDATSAPDTGGPMDAGRADLGPGDVGGTDGGAPDAGEPDLGPADTGEPSDPFARQSCDDITGPCEAFLASEVNELLDRLNDLSGPLTLVLGRGTFALDNALTLRGAAGVTLTGQGIDETILDFSSQVAQSNGVDVVGNDFTISHLTITDSKKDGLRIENSTNVIVRFVKVTWSGGPLSTNGSYGIYPVRCTNVLIEDSEAYNASDAGLYVGQSINAIVRRNIARRNVAGIEIENTQFADVYENLAEDNTGGLLVFDLPQNPVIGRDVKIHANVVRNNNRPNFAPSGTTVSEIPAGTGTFALASRRVEIANNSYENNNTADIALLSGLAVRSSTAAWAIPYELVEGSTVGLGLLDTGAALLNFRTEEIWIHGNTHSGSGTNPDGSDPVRRQLGALIAFLYTFPIDERPVDTYLYDGIGETVVPGTSPTGNTNTNRICVGGNTGGTLAVLDLPKLADMLEATPPVIPTTADIFRPAPPFTPFDCSGFTAGPIPAVTLPF